MKQSATLPPSSEPASPLDVQQFLHSYLAEHATQPESVKMDLAFVAGRVLAEDVHADRDIPPYHRVMMDGYLVHASDLKPGQTLQLSEQGLAAAAPQSFSLSQGQAAPVATGAAFPDGWRFEDLRVVPVEDVEVEENQLKLAAGVSSAPQQYLHLQGSDAPAGTPLLRKGQVIGPMETAICASVGCVTPHLRPQPRLFLCTTGSEVVPVAQTPLQTEIRASHEHMLRHMLADRTATCFSQHVPDDSAAMRAVLEKRSRSADVILVTGGVSKGKHDHTREVLESLGAEIVFHRVSQRPGHPLLVATWNNSLVFGLPGNPLSVTACVARFVIPFLEGWCLGGWPEGRPQLRTEDIEDLSTHTRDERFTKYVAVRPHLSASRSSPHSQALRAQNSGDYRAWAGATGVVDLPPGRDALPDFVDLYPWTLR